MIYLVGSSGLVGSNLMKSFKFDKVFNSKNIEEAYGKKPDVLYYAGVVSKMFLANTNPEADKKHIEDAIRNISLIKPKKVILISTIAVYDNYDNHDEDYEIDEAKLTAYGFNRLYLEKWLINSGFDYLIVRLPALFGSNLSKNFIYDIINPIPSFLNKDKFELVRGSKFEANYLQMDNGFYKLSGDYDRKELYEFFSLKDFTTLSFTDSRANFQFYNLKNLYSDIQKCLKNELKLVNFVSEPINAGELYEHVSGKPYENYLDKPVIMQNLRSKYGYLYDKKTLLKEIKEFIENETKHF